MQINSDLSCRLKRFDVVEVMSLLHANPQSSSVWCRGAICVITEEPQEGYAQVSKLTLEGYTQGEGTLPLDCLKLCEKPVWKAAGQVFRQYTLESEIENETYFRSQKKKFKRKANTIKLLAEKFKLTEDDVKLIYKTIKEA